MATASNEFKLIGPRGTGEYNRSAVTLSCRLSPEISAVTMEIRWFKETDCVCVYKNRQVTEGRRYEGRVSLFTLELERGNVSLHLRHCTRSDRGHYLCQVTDGDRTEEITVVMGVLPLFPWRQIREDPQSTEERDRQVKDFCVYQGDREWTEDVRMKMKISALQTELDQASTSLEHKDQQLEKKDTELRNREKIMEEKDAELKDRNTTLEKTSKELEERDRALHERDQQLKLKDTQIQETQIQVEEKENRLVEKEKELNEKNEELKILKERLETNEKTLSEGDPESSVPIRRRNRQDGLPPSMSGETQDSAAPIRRRNSMEGKHPTLSGETQDSAAPIRSSKSMHGGRPKLSGETQDSAELVRKNNSMEGIRPSLSGETQDSSAPIRISKSMDGDRPKSELRLVLLGKTGSGKSAAGNTIVSREERNQAATSTATSTSTQQSESTQGEVAGRKVTVVDTSNWFSPGLSLEKLRQDVGHCVHLSAPGPHAFLLVIPVKQPTGEERGMLERMEEIFGEGCWRNTMIIFSVTDDLQKKNIEEFIQSGDQEVQRLVEKCANRFHCLNIKESGDGSQVSALLEKIEKMVEGSREKFYSSDIYLETESQIRAMETKILKERKETRVREEMEVKEKIDKEIQNSLKQIKGEIKEHEGDIRQLSVRTTELERKMKEERDEEKKRELERELKREVERRTEMEEKLKKLTEQIERERREMDERHQQEMEKIREVYEGGVPMETESNLMKIILPELQRNILTIKLKKQEEFSQEMEEKNRELETLKQKLFKITEGHDMRKEAYQITVLNCVQNQRQSNFSRMLGRIRSILTH